MPDERHRRRRPSPGRTADGGKLPKLDVPPWFEKALVPILLVARGVPAVLLRQRRHVHPDCTLALAYIVMALGLNIVVGFAGLLDLGYVAFFAIGAYTVGWFGSGFFSQVGNGEGMPRPRRRASPRTCPASTSTSC